MSPERRPSPADQLNEGEWRLLTERLPAMAELAEAGFYRHVSGAAEVVVFPIEYVDAQGLYHYYIYHAETADALTIYDIEPTTHRLQVYDKKQFRYLRDLETADTNFEFDEITGATMPNAQNLAGLKGFLRELQNEEELFAQFNEE